MNFEFIAYWYSNCSIYYACINFFFAIWLANSAVALKEDFDNLRNVEVLFPVRVEACGSKSVFRVADIILEPDLSMSQSAGG